MWPHDDVLTGGVCTEVCEFLRILVSCGWRDEPPFALSPLFSLERGCVTAGAGAASLVYEGSAIRQEPWNKPEEAQFPENCGATTEVQSCSPLGLISERERKLSLRQPQQPQYNGALRNHYNRGTHLHGGKASLRKSL